MLIGINQLCNKTNNYNDLFSKYGDVVNAGLRFNPDIEFLVLTGGADVDPARYGAKREKQTSDPDPWKEKFDTELLPLYIEKGIPIAGICRGHQTLAVNQGMSLTQHVHHTWMNVILFDGYYHVVNSYHHQVVTEANENAEVAAIDTTFGTIEALRYTNINAISVQWHPELLYEDCEVTKKLLSEIGIKEPVKKLRNRKNRFSSIIPF